MQRVIIVDVSNLREDRPGRGQRKTVRLPNGKVKNFALADWRYVEDALHNLAVAAPGSVFYLVADKSMRHDFIDDARGKRTFDRNGKLPCDSFWHMYVMPSRKEVAEWRQDTDFESGVEADQLILYLAASLDGFVVSGDFYRQARYQDQLEKFGRRVFWPAKRIDDSGWCFVKSDEIESVKRNRHQQMQSLTQLESVVAGAPILDAEQARLIKESICEDAGLIDRFWLEYLNEYDLQRGVQRTSPNAPDVPVLTEKSSSINISELSPAAYLPEPVTTSPQVQQPKPANTTSPSRSRIDVVAEHLGIRPPSDDGVEEERKIPIVFAFHMMNLRAAEGSVIQLVGRLRSESSATYLEWYPGDKRVRLRREIDSASHKFPNFVGVTGRLSIRNNELAIDMAETSTPRDFSFEEVVDAISESDSGEAQSARRRWHLPELPRRRLTREKPAAFRPLRPTVPPPGRATQTASESLKPMPDSVVPPLPIPPRMSTRFRTVLLVGLASVIAIISLIASRL